MTESRNNPVDARLTIPNVMTSARVLLAVTAALLFALRESEAVAVAMCVTGVLLDAADGWYARRFGQCTHLGRFLDPLADKILMAVIYGVIAFHIDSIIVWALLILVTGRDIVITISRTNRIRKHGSTYSAGWIGKTKMMVQSIAGLALLVYAFVFNGGFGTVYYPAVASLMIIAALSYVSAGRYLTAGAGPAWRS
jgi:CDP-diacylglycerol--glycerol-3-phosphate 3-phosphatidyltransferase